MVLSEIAFVELLVQLDAPFTVHVIPVLVMVVISPGLVLEYMVTADDVEAPPLT